MKIDKEKHVNIDYILKNDKGEILDSSEGGDPLGYIHGVGAIIPGLENALEGKEEGNEFSVSIKPEDAYGLYMEDLIEEVPIEDLQGIPNLQTGMQLQSQSHQGMRIFTVTKINENSVVMDGNHPLAGETLHFSIKVNEVREATEDELAALEHQCCGGGHHEHEHAHEHGGGCQSGSCNC
ncbi:MAG: peptidylprolyl isomerase [Spirochaetia bacterium]|nr:peptidylprolyl isomerase [Spirochaetia bacterium]